MAIPNGSFVRVTVRGVLTGQQCEITQVYRAASPLTFADITPAHTAIVLKWETVYLQQAIEAQASGWRWTEVRSQVYTPDATYVPMMTAIDKAGLLTTAPLPSEVALVTTKTSPLAGKRNRGRMYWPGMAISAVSVADGFWNIGTTDIMAPLAQEIGSTTILPLGTTPGLLPCVTNADLTLFTYTTGGGVNFAPRAQRRRQIGRGV